MTPRFDSAAQLRIQSLNRVRRVDDPPHRYGKGEERNDLGPVAPPAPGDRRIFSSPSAGIDGVERPFASLCILGAVDRLQLGRDGFTFGRLFRRGLYCLGK